MQTIINSIEKEIATLEHVKNILIGEQQEISPQTIHIVRKRKHKMSQQGRDRIAAAARLRWKRVRAESRQAAKARQAA